MSTRKKIREIAKLIAARFQPEKVILFGSWAWGSPGPDSDVDLLIIKHAEDTRQLAREIDGFLFPRPFPIDLIVNRPQDVERRLSEGDFFISNVLRNGQTLYAK